MTKILVLNYSMYGHVETLAGAIAGPDGSRRPSAKELAQARFQGRHVASIARKLSS